MTILNSSFTTNDIGIEVTAAASVNLTSNQIFSNSTYGVYVHDSSGSNVTVVNNDIYANGQDGVYFKNASRPLNVSGNRITGNGTTLGSGIRSAGQRGRRNLGEQFCASKNRAKLRGQ